MNNIAQQLTFPGFEPAPAERLFFAVLPDAETAARIVGLGRELRDECGVRGKPFAASRLHISLHYVGDFHEAPDGIVERADEAARAVTAEPFEVVFDRVGSFAGKASGRPLVLFGGDGLGDVAA